jgi:2-dehydro-3-deoxyphosphogluconate aldolase / (4S)-4-hydroxy-2-oxoglutarate aldolase
MQSNTQILIHLPMNARRSTTTLKMAHFTRIQVNQTLLETGLVPLFYHPDPEIAYQVALACYAGGARVLEFTNRGDFAHEVFGNLVKRVRQTLPDLVIGAGSIQDAGTAALFIQCGADFIVTPLLREDVIFTCNRRKIPIMPGVSTASEIGRAEELGVEIVKIAPGEVLGPAFLKAHSGPCPWTRSMVSGGVSPDAANLKAWFEAGATCVGMGSKLISNNLLADKDWAALSSRVGEVVDIIAGIKR